ncbi:2-deoxy-D-gluconate 3-dehydrogenase, partial [Methylobacterium radiotolerans]
MAAEAIEAVGGRLDILINNAGACIHRPAQETAAEIEAVGRRAWVVLGDLTERPSVDRIAAEAIEAVGGRLDILINNAGACIHRPA